MINSGYGSIQVTQRSSSYIRGVVYGNSKGVGDKYVEMWILPVYQIICKYERTKSVGNLEARTTIGAGALRYA